MGVNDPQLPLAQHESPVPDEPHPCHIEECPGMCRYEGIEANSLADGGSSELYRCDTCRRPSYSPMAD